MLVVYYLPKFDISLQCCYSWHTSTQYYKTLPITKLQRIAAQEIKFWSKYPSLCYITANYGAVLYLGNYQFEFIYILGLVGLYINIEYIRILDQPKGFYYNWWLVG